MKHRWLLLLSISLTLAVASTFVIAQQGTTHPTPTPPVSNVLRTEVILRGGPGEQYLPVGGLQLGDTIRAVSRNADSTWVMIPYRRGFGWLRRDLAFWAENVESLPVISENNLTPTVPPGRETATPFFPTATPTGSYVRVTNAESAFVRAGPGQGYLRLGDLLPGDVVEPVARNEDTTWIMIRFASELIVENPDDEIVPGETREGFGWIRRDLVVWDDLLNTLPVVSEDNLTPTATFTPTNTPTHTATASSTPTATESFTPTNTPTETYTPSNTATATQTASLTPTHTATFTPQPSRTRVPTDTDVPPSPTASNTMTETPLPPTATPSNTATATQTASLTPTHTATHTETTQPSETPAEVAAVITQPAPTDTPSPTHTETATATETAQPTETPTHTPSPTETVQPSATLTDTAAPSETATPTVAESPALTATAAQVEAETITPTRLTEEALGVIIAATETAEAALVPDAPDDGSDGLPIEAIIGGIGVLLVLVYTGFYLRGAAVGERYAKGFAIERCPVCQRGNLTVETRQDRLFGIPRIRHTVRCDNCRSVLRETEPRRWRYAVDRLANPAMYERFNGRELNESALITLAKIPIAPGDVTSRPVTPPSFVDDESETS